MQQHIDRVHAEMVDTGVARAAERGWLAHLEHKAIARHTMLRSAWPARTLREVVASEAALIDYDTRMCALAEVMGELIRVRDDQHYETTARAKELRAAIAAEAPKDNYDPLPQRKHGRIGTWARAGHADWFLMGMFCMGGVIVSIKLAAHFLS